MSLTRILFLCHGNICRSAMAEFIFRDMVKKAGRESEFEIASAAVSREAVGSDMYPSAQIALTLHGVPFTEHRAHQVTEEEMQRFDCIVIMDESNRSYLRRMFGDRYLGKVHLIMEYTGCARDVEDPWYTWDYETAYADIVSGCEALLPALTQQQTD